jgi:hypothetical protein
MTSLPPRYPQRVVFDWIAGKGVHVLTVSTERELIDVTWNDCPSPLDYDVCVYRAEK